MGDDRDENMPILSAHGICKTYEKPGRPMARFWSEILGRGLGPSWHTVLDGVNLQVMPRETVGLLGLNGAGKSTLLAILAGTKHAVAGSIETRGRIVPVLELGGSFDDDRTGRANVIDFARAFGVGGRELDRVVADTQAFADVGDYFDKPIRTHSSGMKARVAFAAALALRGDLIMLDETLAVGDLSFRLKCYDLIRALQRQGTAFLLVSHNPNTLANLCTRVIVLDGAHFVYDGPPSEAVIAYKQVRLGPAQAVACGPASIALQGGASGEMTVNYRDCVRFEIVVEHCERTEPLLSIGLYTEQGVAVFATKHVLSGRSSNDLTTIAASVEIPGLLMPGRYLFTSRLFHERDGEEITLVNKPRMLVVTVLDSHIAAHDRGVIDLDFRAVASPA